MGTPLDSYFTIANGTYTLKSDPSISLGGGEATLFVEVNGAIGLPKGQMDYSLQGKFYRGFCFRRYERAVVVYDPQHKMDAEPGFGDFYLAHLDAPVFPADESAALAAAQAAKAADDASIAALTTQVATLTAELASKPSVDPAVVSALQSASQLLAPSATAAAEVAVALKAVGA
jgi:hypothetical protein